MRTTTRLGMAGSRYSGQNDGMTGKPPSAARIAKEARSSFHTKAEILAGRVLGSTPQPFSPSRMSVFARWFEDASHSQLVAVVAPTELAISLDEVIAYGFAWQGDRELILVVPAQSSELAEAAGVRLPWFHTPVRVVVYDQDLDPQPFAVPSKDEALALLQGLPHRKTVEYELTTEHLDWLSALPLEGLTRHARPGYVSWHLDGLQILKASRARGGGLNVAAGVQYSNMTGKPPTFNRVITEPLSGTDLHDATKAVNAAIHQNGSMTSSMLEHRVQSRLAGMAGSLGLVTPMHREYPAYRSRKRPGFIDFLGCASNGDLHVVETKIGHDPRVVLQALDYCIWVTGNQDGIRSSQPHWPSPQTVNPPVHLDLVLAPKNNTPAFNAYLAGQLEALGDTFPWRVFVIDDPAADQLVITQLESETIWTSAPKRVAAPVVPPRSMTISLD